MARAPFFLAQSTVAWADAPQSDAIATAQIANQLMPRICPSSRCRSFQGTWPASGSFAASYLSPGGGRRQMPAEGGHMQGPIPAGVCRARPHAGFPDPLGCASRAAAAACRPSRLPWLVPVHVAAWRAAPPRWGRRTSDPKGSTILMVTTDTEGGTRIRPVGLLARTDHRFSRMRAGRMRTLVASLLVALFGAARADAVISFPTMPIAQYREDHRTILLELDTTDATWHATGATSRRCNCAGSMPRT